MVCPNCHSDQVIAVQDQHFCINCGQLVPESAIKPTKTSSPIAVQPNGLPEGVKILPVAGAPKVSVSAPKPVPEPAPITAKQRNLPVIQIGKSSHAAPAIAPSDLVKPRARMGSVTAAPAHTSTPKPKKRPPGRPKAGRLDVPSSQLPALKPAAPESTVKSTAVASSDAVSPTPSVVAATAPIGPKRMSDITSSRHSSPSHPAAKASPATAASAHPNTSQPPEVKPSKTASKRHSPKPTVHKLGVPPLHYGAVAAASLRAHAKPRFIGLAALGSLVFAAAAAYGAWLMLNGGLPRLATTLLTAGPQLLGEVALLAVLYYVGHSVGQAAIVYGVAREADHRPVSLSHQLAVGFNTFGRRLRLDLGFGLVQALMVIGIIVLLFTGGADWRIGTQLQVAALFGVFMVILYLLTSLTIARGLAGVILTLTSEKPWAAARFGWRLFSHRFELLALRFSAAMLELLFAIPLAALAAAFIAAAPGGWHLEVALGVGVLAWLAGAIIGAGTSAWWVALYRRLVLVDHPDGAAMLLSGTQPQAARLGALISIVGLTSFLLFASLALPWLKF